MRFPSTGHRRVRMLHAAVLIVLAAAPAARLQSRASDLFTRVETGPVATAASSAQAAVWVDYNKDGFPDLFVGNGYSSQHFLYRNNGAGDFTPIKTGTLVETIADSTSCIWGDYDNDGNLDLFTTNFGAPAADVLYRGNPDGTFAIANAEAAIPADINGGLGAVWVDFDRDGHLDLMVANWANQGNAVYRNRGDGTFELLSNVVSNSGGCNTQSITAADLDGDGWPEVVLGNLCSNLQTLHNHLGEYSLPEENPDAPSLGTQSEGIATGDIDNDGLPDIAVARWPGRITIIRNLGGMRFEPASDILLDEGGHASVAFADVDNNGWLDLFVTGIMGNHNKLYLNNRGEFTPVTEGVVVEDGGASYGCSFGDYDNDGFLDLFVANAGPDPNAFPQLTSKGYLYHNHPNGNGWLLLRLVGSQSNRSAIGAKVHLASRIGGELVRQVREVSGGSGWFSQNDLRIHFGLGDATKIESLRIEWPSGIVQEFANFAMNRVATVVETPMLRATGAGSIRIVGARDWDYVIEASEDLKAWSPVTRLPGGSTYTDANRDKFPRRYYRALAMP